MKEKYCPSCKINKDTSEFRPNITRNDKLQGYCEVCDKKQQRLYYLKNKTQCKSKAVTTANKQRLWWKDYKSKLKCNRCEESHPACLQFHHKDPSTKDVTIAAIVGSWSKERILKEVAKCEILCANCHAKEHWVNPVPRKKNLSIGLRKVTRPEKADLEKMVWEIPTTSIAKQYGVSDKAIGKWCESYGIGKPPRGYWSKRKQKV